MVVVFRDPRVREGAQELIPFSPVLEQRAQHGVICGEKKAPHDKKGLLYPLPVLSPGAAAAEIFIRRQKVLKGDDFGLGIHIHGAVAVQVDVVPRVQAEEFNGAAQSGGVPRD